MNPSAPIPEAALLPGAQALNQAIVFLASCQYPPDLGNGRIAYRSLERMGRRLSERQARAATPSLLLLAGDSVYVDATAGLFDPLRDRDRYEAPYEQLLSQPVWRRLREQLDALHATLDDHELMENWEPVVPVGATESASRDRAELSTRLRRSREVGVAAFRQGLGFPGEPHRQDPDSPIWRATATGPVHCFVMDTRTERGFRSAGNLAEASLVSVRQLRYLIRWLARRQRTDPTGPKFVLSGSMLLPRRRTTSQGRHAAMALLSDAWDGYPATLTALLDFIARHQIENVFFLSGDEHLGCLATITLRRPGLAPLRVVSIHAPPLHAPFPFVNGRVHHFAGKERFQFTGRRAKGRGGPGMVTEVDVSTRFAEAGDGFVELILGAEEDGTRWLDCRFDLGHPGGAGIGRHAGSDDRSGDLTERFMLGARSAPA